MKNESIATLAIALILILFTVTIIHKLSPKYEWYFFFTATAASVTASIIYGFALKHVIEA